MKVKVEAAHITTTQRYLLQKLADIPDTHMMAGSESGAVQHDFDALIRLGLARQELGFYQITDAGRSRLRSNTGA